MYTSRYTRTNLINILRDRCRLKLEDNVRYCEFTRNNMDCKWIKVSHMKRKDISREVVFSDEKKLNVDSSVVFIVTGVT